jgi:hypothetical protein
VDGKGVTASTGVLSLGINETKSASHKIFGVVDGEAIEQGQQGLLNHNLEITRLERNIVGLDPLGWTEIVDPLGAIAGLKMNPQAMVMEN